MQEGPPLGLDPLSINYQLPWTSRLLILYLLVVVTVSLVKSASVLRTLWLSKHGSLQESSTEDEFVLAWERCSNKVQSIKRWAFVTLPRIDSRKVDKRCWRDIAITLITVALRDNPRYGPIPLRGVLRCSPANRSPL